MKAQMMDIHDGEYNFKMKSVLSFICSKLKKKND